jgi:hypothetical protein
MLKFLLIFLNLYTLKVNIINKTDPSIIPPRNYVKLLGLNSAGNVIFRDSVLAKRGIALFKVKDTTLFYAALFKYKGILYYGRNEMPGIKPITIEIYESIDKSPKIRGLAYHAIMMSAKNDTLGVTEIERVSLDTNCAYNGKPVLFLHVPFMVKGSFKPFIPGDTAYWKLVHDTVYYTGPLYPGKQMIAFSYMMPFQDGFKFDRVLPVTTELVELYLAPELKVKNTNLKFEGIKKIARQQFNYFSGQNVKEVMATLTTKTPGPGRRLTWILFGVVVVLVVVLIYLRVSKERVEEEVAEGEEQDLEEDR